MKGDKDYEVRLTSCIWLTRGDSYPYHHSHHHPFDYPFVETSPTFRSRAGFGQKGAL